MLSLKQILTFAYVSEYESAYDLSQKKNYSIPKIHMANGDLNKRWYVYFSFRHPETGKMKRVTPFYGCAHKYKTKGERMEVLSVYRRVLHDLLKQGFNPFEDNAALFNKLYAKQESRPQEIPQVSPEQVPGKAQEQVPGLVPENVPGVQAKVQEEVHEVQETTKPENLGMPLREAFDFALKLKSNVVSPRTIIDYKHKVKNFLEWQGKECPEIKFIKQLDKVVFVSFLNHISIKNSARYRNNYRTELSSLVGVLADNDIVQSNFLQKIPKLKSKPKMHKRYTMQEQEAIFDHLEKSDPVLLLFIKFVSYNFLRPIEVCRIQIKDIDQNNKTFQYIAKGGASRVKIIPKILWDELPDLSKFNADDYLFTPDKIGGKWDADENHKRQVFSERFREDVKKPFGLGREYGLYSFRHTFATKLYRVLLKDAPPFEAKSKLMTITGHRTMAALDKYLRDMDAYLPEDYSELFKKEDE
ncbi:site-specific integrase [Seonamhaeicola sp. ML3]|uniref:tyrosine-type recombinase/integrase n=1 Tax=Seonamhaeicola sp. ML3 TaxID=2937786 RepID=UPI00200D3344|nr:site-specific integrase [Seonamhaeicola sp. ML3]